MNFQQLLMAAATRVEPVVAAGGELYPDPTIQNVVDYAFSGGTESGSVEAGVLHFLDVIGGEACIITGDTRTLLNVALSNSTPYQVSVTVANHVAGSKQFRLKGGAFVDLGITGNGVSAPVTVTAGVLTDARFFDPSEESPATFDITHISITA